MGRTGRGNFWPRAVFCRQGRHEVVGSGGGGKGDHLYVSYPGAEDAELMARRFVERYPAIKVNIVCATAQVMPPRLQHDMEDALKNCDVPRDHGCRPKII